MGAFDAENSCGMGMWLTGPLSMNSPVRGLCQISRHTTNAWTGGERGCRGRLGACQSRQDHPRSISRVFATTSARCWSVPGSLAIRPTITASSSGRRVTSVQRLVVMLARSIHSVAAAGA